MAVRRLPIRRPAPCARRLSERASPALRPRAGVPVAPPAGSWARATLRAVGRRQTPPRGHSATAVLPPPPFLGVDRRPPPFLRRRRQSPPCFLRASRQGQRAHSPPEHPSGGGRRAGFPRVSGESGSHSQRRLTESRRPLEFPPARLRSRRRPGQGRCAPRGAPPRAA